MKWHLIIPVSLVGLVVAGGVALAAARHVRSGGWRHDPAFLERRIANRMEHVLDELDATDAQRAQAREILKRHAPDLKALRERHEATHDEIEGLWRGAGLDPAALRGLIDRKIEEARDAGYKVADAASEFHGILTPEQREQLADLAEERHGGRRRCR